MRPVFLLLGTALLLAAAPAARAQTFTLIYDFLGQPGNQASQAPLAATVPAGLLASNLTRGPGLSVASGAGSLAAGGFTTGAFDPGDYFAFTVAPAAGRTLTLTDLTFSERRSASGIRGFSLRSSRDGFASDLYAGTVPDNTLTRRQAIALGAAFTGLTESVELRLYGYRAESGAGTWRLGTSANSGENPLGLPPDLRLNGSLEQPRAEAPEPGSATLCLLGIAVAARGLRRRGNRV